MKATSIIALLFVGILATLALCADTTEKLDLDGRKLMVRVYGNWRVKPDRMRRRALPFDEPEAFEKVSVQFSADSVALHSIRSTPNQPGEATVFVIIAEDQNDTVVKKALGDSIYAQPYEQELRFSPRPAGKRPGVWLSFNDALGEPIPQATAEIFLADCRSPTKASVRRVSLDEKGRMAMPLLTGDLNELSLIVSDPNYGIAVVKEVYPWRREKDFSLPLSKIGTKADEQSIWGLVTDPQGNPVQGAMVKGVMASYTAARAKMRSVSRSNVVLTDYHGRFAMHLPVKKSTEAGAAVPPVCNYAVSVKAPKGLGLMPYSGTVRNGQETTIVLQKQPEKYYRTFAFEDKNGPVTDPNHLKEVIIIAGTEHSGPTYEYDSWKDGLTLPLGTYRAAIRTTGPERHTWDTIEVTADSPQQLIFKICDSVLYIGKAVDGLTGRPAAGAFIVATGWFTKDFSAITPEQWVLLRELPTNLSGDEPALEPVRKICDFERVARSEDDGTFYLSFAPLDKFYQLIVFDRGCLHVAHRRDRFEPDQYNYVQLPESRLYPAAKLTIEPYVEVKERNSRVIGWWYFDEDNNHAWVKDFQAYRSTRKASFTHLLKRYLELNKSQTIQVPAGVNMRIRLVYIGSGEGKLFWCPVFTEMFKAGEGETIDLGRYAPFAPEMPVYVEIVDSLGNPLEGVGVKHLDRAGSYFGQTHISDPNGIAEFTVPQDYKGEFCVGCIDADKKFIKQSIFYETNGPQDANTVYTLPISDEMLEALFK